MSVGRRLQRMWSSYEGRGFPFLTSEVARRLPRWARVSQTDESELAYRVFQAGQSPGVMIDGGAHHGGALRRFANAGWRVHAFEPDPDDHAILMERFGRHPDVSIDPRAVSDREEPAVTFHRSPESTGISGLLPFHASHRPAGGVATTTFAAYIAAHGVNRVDFLKVDAEGSDYQVLLGFPWDRLRPRLVACEFEDAKLASSGPTCHDLARPLIDRGYAVMVSEWYPIKRYGGNHRWRRYARYPAELRDSRAWGNLLAARDAEVVSGLLAACG